MTTPKKYRKKPVTVEASRWWEAGDHDKVGLYLHPPVDRITGEISVADDALWMDELRHSEVPGRFRRETCDALMHDHGWIDTLEGGHTVCPGDWIIQGVAGEHYPVKPDIFAATYEEAEGVTTNIDRAAEVIADALRPALAIADGIGHDLARAQAAAGVIAPDLPEFEDQDLVGIDDYGHIFVRHEVDDQWLAVEEAHDLAFALLAAANQAEKDMAE